MKSAPDCFNHATRCEEMARASNDHIGRRMLLATARVWRQLGQASKDMEAKPHRFIERQVAREG
jgi:hypothetical protein